MKVAGVDTVCSPQLRLRVDKLFPRMLSVTLNGRSGKQRQFTALTGLGPNHNLGLYNAKVAVAERALVERSFLCLDGAGFRPALKVRHGAFQTETLNEFLKGVTGNMPHIPRVSYEDVVSSYAGDKRATYQEALNSIRLRPFVDKDSELGMFVKREKQDVGKAPRVINPRSRRYNLELGRYLKLAEHKYFNAINCVFGARTPATVVKGFNVVTSANILRSKWDQFERPVAIGADATKFDMHVSVKALKYEHQFYKKMFPGDNFLRRLLRLQLRNRGVGRFPDGKVRFSLSGTRCSGDLNTSLGNCLLMCALMWSYAKERAVRVELANNGDDCMLFMESKDLARFVTGFDAWFRRKGFAVVLEKPVREFEQIEFCQTHPVWDGVKWRMVRNHLAVLTKDPMCLVDVPNWRTYQKWLGGVGTCGMALASGLPVQQEFYTLYRRLSGGVVCNDGFLKFIMKNTERLNQARGQNPLYGTIKTETRVSYWAAFGVLPDRQIDIEEHYRNLLLSERERFEGVVDRSYFGQLLTGDEFPSFKY